MTDAAPSSRFDYTGWPVVHFHMPERVADGQSDAQVAEFDALLDRGERFVLVTSGPMMPAKSKHFMKRYGDWSKRNRDRMGRLCAGSIRIESDAAKRGSFMTMAMTFLARNSVPYPVVVVATEDEARTTAAQWMGG